MPLSMMGDCAPGGLSEKSARLQRRLESAAHVAALAALTLAAGAATHLLPRGAWAPAAGATLVAALLAAASHFLGALIVHADCFLMRGHDITQQPMRLALTMPLMLQDAVAFLRR